MPYIIAEPCIGTKDASCVDVCPVDCIHSTDDSPQYYINPDQCIDCAACELACPVTAIFHDASVPTEWEPFIAVNADFFKDRN
jgi:ferredoxin